MEALLYIYIYIGENETIVASTTSWDQRCTLKAPLVTINYRINEEPDNREQAIRIPVG